MPSLYSKRPTVSFRPSENAREALENFTKQYATKRGKIMSLMVDYAVRHEEDFALYLKQNEKYLNSRHAAE